MTNLYRLLPKMDTLLEAEELSALREQTPYPVFLEATREALEELRALIRQPEEGVVLEVEIKNIGARIEKNIHKTLHPHLVPVINATGVVLHTNLGRAVMDEHALLAMKHVAAGYSNLEYDLDKGARGSRYDHLIEKLRIVTGAEDAMVVNNNAAAVMLVLSTLAKGKEVITSRGELIEIGGSFRIPSVMEQSGAHLKEVGTTNKTHPADYQNALSEHTGALLRVHTSNYRVIGFTDAVSVQELVEIRDGWEKETGVHLPLIEDLGSGILIDLSDHGLPYEPTVQEAVHSGMDVVTFSGDKLLGGPQAGLIVGKAEYLEKMRKNQLTRALRVDKFTIAALEYTLSQYLDPENALTKIPTLRMLTDSQGVLSARAESLRLAVTAIEGVDARIIDTISQVGGGSLPGVDLPSKAVELTTPFSAQKLERLLRCQPLPVIVRVQNDRVLLDVRTVQPGQEADIQKSLRGALEASS